MSHGDALPIPVHTLTRAELPVAVGVPADRVILRAHMPWAQGVIRDHWQALGADAIAEVIAVEAGYLYRWMR